MWKTDLAMPATKTAMTRAPPARHTSLNWSVLMAKPPAIFDVNIGWWDNFALVKKLTTLSDNPCTDCQKCQVTVADCHCLKRFLVKESPFRDQKTVTVADCHCNLCHSIRITLKWQLQQPWHSSSCWVFFSAKLSTCCTGSGRGLGQLR